MANERPRGQAAISLAQGAYWAATGIWPWIHYRSFERVTGPKREPWLVKTVGALITVVGAVLTSAGARRSVSPEVKALGIGSALALAGVDALYVAKREISPVYLADAVAELLIAAGWVLASRGGVPSAPA